MSAITLTRVRLANRLSRPFRTAYLRALIRSAESDIRYFEHEMARGPLLAEQIKIHRACIEAMRVQIIQLGAIP